MAHLPGTADEISGARARACSSRTRSSATTSSAAGSSTRTLKELCFRYLAEDPESMDFAGFDGAGAASRLDWAHAIAWDSDSRGRRALGAGSTRSSASRSSSTSAARSASSSGQQHWRRTVGLPARDERSSLALLTEEPQGVPAEDRLLVLGCQSERADDLGRTLERPCRRGSRSRRARARRRRRRPAREARSSSCVTRVEVEAAERVVR